MRTWDFSSGEIKSIIHKVKSKDIETEFIREYLINSLISNKKIREYSYDRLLVGLYRNLLKLVQQVDKKYRKENHGLKSPHKPILKKIMIKHPNAMASEVPVWKDLDGSEYCVGSIDLILVNKNTLIIADLKDNETDMIKSLPQIVCYGIMLRELIFDTLSGFRAFDLKCICFSRNKVWEFEPVSLMQEIIDFIIKANELRETDLMSKSFADGLPRTNLLEDLQKIFKKYLS